MSSPSTPSPAAHLFATIAPATRTRGRAAASSASGRSHRHTLPPPRHHLATDRPANSSRAAPRRSAILPASSSSYSPPSGGEGRAASQPGRAILSSSPRRLSPPCGGTSAYMRTPPEIGEGGMSTYQGGEARPCDSKFREFLRGCIALNINYLFSPLGYAMQSQYIGEMVIVLKVLKITN